MKITVLVTLMVFLAYYQDPKKHIESFLHGIPLFAAIAALTALIVTVL